ncbi:interactor of constitutive active ROPs 4-like [Impatiens glandulifera]|uniref:interactor of constitutive active ROPs 4-like n=1 Tax=Impatiens glandulifera TaxID=253017 RepID=UPI001FB13CD5|nr:interactor of constitutive active ROPs 4-like [Impatiens glandulifera]XP_047334923.1 interactor of constitutive active ROPs 4-like [Impatiens glandulifera]
MPRSRSDPARGSEMPNRQTPKGPTPRSSRTSSSDSDPSHLRPINRNPRSVERRSPAKSEPLTQKKLGTRIADLESQLGAAQTELRILKDQLASTEEAKRLAEEQDNTSGDKQESQPETDVFEVLVETYDTKKPVRFDDELALKNEEISLLKSIIEEKDRELEITRNGNNAMIEKADELHSLMATYRSKEVVAGLKLGEVEKELEECKENENRIKEKIEAMEASKVTMEAEMKKMRVQTDQWRKAADAAAAMLSEVVMEKNGRKIITTGKFGSMEGKYRGGGGMYDADDEDEDDDDLEMDGKRKGWMFGDLWRKKGQK